MKDSSAMNGGNVVSAQDAKTMGMAFLNALREDLR